MRKPVLLGWPAPLPWLAVVLSLLLAGAAPARSAPAASAPASSAPASSGPAPSGPAASGTAAPAPGTPPPAAAPLPGGIVLRVPVPGSCVSSPFGRRRAVGPNAALFHNGLDLPGPPGTWVTAAATGQVAAVRRLGSSGLEVDISHTPDVLTRYAHLGTVSPAIAGGSGRVSAGERIGRIGRTGITYGTHLHFEVHLHGLAVDPAPYLAVRPCGAG